MSYTHPFKTTLFAFLPPLIVKLVVIFVIVCLPIVYWIAVCSNFCNMLCTLDYWSSPFSALTSSAFMLEVNIRWKTPFWPVQWWEILKPVLDINDQNFAAIYSKLTAKSIFRHKTLCGHFCPQTNILLKNC